MPLTGAIPEGRNSAYAARLQRLASLLDRSASHRSVPIGDLRGSVGAMELVHRIVSALPETREPFWRVFTTCARENPNATRIIVGLMALYLHLGPLLSPRHCRNRRTDRRDATGGGYVRVTVCFITASLMAGGSTPIGKA